MNDEPWIENSEPSENGHSVNGKLLRSRIIAHGKADILCVRLPFTVHRSRFFQHRQQGQMIGGELQVGRVADDGAFPELVGKTAGEKGIVETEPGIEGRKGKSAVLPVKPPIAVRVVGLDDLLDDFRQDLAPAQVDQGANPCGHQRDLCLIIRGNAVKISDHDMGLYLSVSTDDAQECVYLTDSFLLDPFKKMGPQMDTVNRT